VIQAGDPESKSHKKDIELGDGELKYKVPAEIIPGMFHKKGVLAAARESDSVNPERASSSTHFYIAIGKVQTDEDLAKAEARINKANKTNDFKFLPEVAKVYKTIGGIPHLDTQYTIFGEVVKGLEIAENISLTATDKRDRPLEDIVIISTKVRHLRKY
jgi:peptidyl-prolyl cis-trans isomerase B (cyclophilin B)